MKRKWLSVLMIFAIATSVSGCWPLDRDKDESTTTTTTVNNDPGQMQIVTTNISDDGQSVYLSGSAKNVGSGKCTDITLWVEIQNLRGSVIWYDSRTYPLCNGGDTISYSQTANIGSAAVSAGYNGFYAITYYYYNIAGAMRKVGK